MVAIAKAVPAELRIDQLTGSNAFVKNRRQIEILPDGQSEYGSLNGNYRATFNVGSSANEFLDSLNSYFRCDLTVTTTAAAETNTVRAYLDEGGIHSLIRSVTIQTRNGVRIEHLDHYNKLFSMLRNATMSKGQVDSVSSFESGDSLAYRPYLDADQLYFDTASVTPTDDANGLLIPAAAAHTAIGAGAYDVAAVNAAITSLRTNINTALSNGGTRLRKPARYNYANGDPHKVTFKLLSDFLSSVKYLPLPMLNQLQIVFEFERPDIGLFVTKCVSANGTPLINIQDGDKVNYKIEKFRYVASMVEVSDSVMAEYEKAYMGEGIDLPFSTFRSFKNTLTSTSASFELQFSANSVRYALIGIMANQSFNEGNSARVWHSNSWFLKDNLKDFRLQSGGKVFPAHAPVSVETSYGAEAFTNLMIALNQHNNNLNDTCMRVWEWDQSQGYAVSAGTGEDSKSTSPISFLDATKFIIGVDLSTVDRFSGLNTTNNNLVVELNFTAEPVDEYKRNALCFLAYDSTISLQKDLGVLVRH
jgi:hypothetical protein